MFTRGKCCIFLIKHEPASMTIYNCTLESIYLQLWVLILHSRKTDVIWYTKNKQNPQHKNVYKNSLKIPKKYSEEK